ncbi:unnamed protein product [Leuciscus chuanchicus]
MDGGRDGRITIPRPPGGVSAVDQAEAKLPCCAGLISEPPLGCFMKTYGQGESPLPDCILRACQLVSQPSLIPALIYSSPPGKQQPTPASGVPSLQPPGDTTQFRLGTHPRNRAISSSQSSSRQALAECSTEDFLLTC